MVKLSVRYLQEEGFELGVLNEANYVLQGKNPSRSKSVYITDSGIKKAEELLKEYGIEDLK